MRLSLVVYGLLYIAIELIGARLEEIGRPRLTALDIATAVTHALVTVSIGVAALLALDVVGRHWRRSRRLRPPEHAAEESAAGTITVQAWRPRPLELPGPPAPGPFTGPDYSSSEDGSLPLYVASEILDRDGRLL